MENVDLLKLTLIILLNFISLDYIKNIGNIIFTINTNLDK